MALAIPFGEVFDVGFTSLISGCTFSSNSYITKDSIVLSISNSFCWGRLCWLSDDYKTHLIGTPSELEKTELGFMLQIILSSVLINNDTIIYNQPGIIGAFIATINISDITIRNTEFNRVSIQVTASNSNLKNVTIGNKLQELVEILWFKLLLMQFCFWMELITEIETCQCLTF